MYLILKKCFCKKYIKPKYIKIYNTTDDIDIDVCQKCLAEN